MLTMIILFLTHDERAVIPLLVGGAWLIFIRTICLNDSRAQEKFYWKLRGVLTRLQCGRTSAAVYTVHSNNKSQRRDKIAKFIKNHSN